MRRRTSPPAAPSSPSAPASLDDGTRGKMQVKPGDRVLFTSYAGETFKIGDDELLLMREDDILAVIE
jgi:chaperonin GroES